MSLAASLKFKSFKRIIIFFIASLSWFTILRVIYSYNGIYGGLVVWNKKRENNYRPTEYKTEAKFFNQYHDTRPDGQKINRTRELSDDNCKNENLCLPNSTSKMVVLSNSCEPKYNLAFIKTRKTGGTTMSSVLHRYGSANQLSFVFNKYRKFSGHFPPFPAELRQLRKILLPPKCSPDNSSMRPTFKYNMLSVHVRFNRHALDSIMNVGTKYVTILREPGSHWDSVYHYYDLQNIIPIFTKRSRATKEGNNLDLFFESPQKYLDQLIRTDDERRLYARNCQFFDLGVDQKNLKTEVDIKREIFRLDKELDFVAITEYYDVSLVLLKRLMCWDDEDILYFIKNARDKKSVITKSLRTKIRLWNKADSMLYDHFKNVLLRKISELGTPFQEELANFRSKLRELNQTCELGRTNIRRENMHNPIALEQYISRARSRRCMEIGSPHHVWIDKLWDMQTRSCDFVRRNIFAQGKT